MKKKIRVGILFGGKSAEHEVSLQSAKNVYEAIDRDKYDITLIGIDKEGKWHLDSGVEFLLNGSAPKLIELNNQNNTYENLALILGKKERPLVRIDNRENIGEIDVIFPLLHGPNGEDGTVQGMLKLANIPFVGTNVLGSAIGMDKDVMKRLLRDAGIRIPKFLALNRPSAVRIEFSSIKDLLGIPFFVKPANLGSSVGVNKVHGEAELKSAIEEALRYDHKILLEEYINGRELECSVLGNDDAIASVPGEIILKHEFYSYEAKYIDENGAILKIPADVPEHITKGLQETAIKVFKILCCEGMARVDFFLRDDSEIIVNEINTIPGFTKISMFPKLLEASGISYAQLIDKLIQLALERDKRDKMLSSSYKLP